MRMNRLNPPDSQLIMTTPPLPSPADDPRQVTTCALPSDAVAAEMLRILDHHMADLKAGRAVSRAELVALHPHLASQLDACLAGLEFIHGNETQTPGKYQRLGDFRIIREVGRGGMGAVYEAEQISLQRIVALKIMRFGSVADPEAILRFQREAETVAKFHHTNIVPIFAVGVDQGVNYYAMQLIEGQSLAQVLSERPHSIDAKQVAHWGLQASEALSHAHLRGVVHRDVKPSNLLLDAENRLWLTDFGLARKLDNVTLSIAGAIIGTPRYMSPEQATAAVKRVDNRSDIFSLGATLYELLTGVPAFRGDTPMAVIHNILTAEPVPVRVLSPTTHRDLETIVMKCLAKEPCHRYESADDLAADLRAFSDGRSIQARRANAIERSVRWLRRQQSSVKLAAAVATVTVLATLASIAGWLALAASIQGSLQLSAATPPLLVEILDQAQQPLRVETAPMQNPVKLAAGNYQVRVSAEGELSESYDVTIQPGKDLEFSLDPDDQLLWRHRDIERSFDITPFGDGNTLINWTKAGLEMWKRFPPQTLFTTLGQASLLSSAEAPGVIWPWNTSGSPSSVYGPFDLRPWVAKHKLDVNGDGQLDLIFAARHQAWIAAISGETGQVLWLAARGRDVIEVVSPTGSFQTPPIISSVLNDPILDHDCDHDGVPDIVAILAETQANADPNAGRPVVRYWIEAISSCSGQTIWRFDIPAEYLSIEPNEEVPIDLRWFVGYEAGYSAGGGGSSMIGRHRVRTGGWPFERLGAHGYRPAAFTSFTTGASARLGIVAGSTFFSLEPTTGCPADEPIDLGIRPGRVCQWGDLDGDGDADIAMLETVSDAATGAKVRLVAWSPSQRKQLWDRLLDADWPRMPDGSIEAPRWPLVCDLDGDGKCELIAPDGRSPAATVTTFVNSQLPWGNLCVIEGATGQTRWSQRLVTMDCQIDQVIDGPDIDQDGCRDLFVATLVGDDFRTYVDAVSGRSGETLWTNSTTPPSDNNSSREFYLAPLVWWSASADGWPQLLVQIVAGGSGAGQNIVSSYSARDGRTTRIGHNITSTRPADMDGDGVPDLLMYNSRSPHSTDNGGVLHCLRGVPFEAWAQLGDRGEPLCDFDGDGIRDLIAGWPDSALEATSGSSGKMLWRTEINSDLREFHARSAAANTDAVGDLDGDGIGDLLCWTFVSRYREKAQPFFALSGKTGRRLWTAQDIGVQIVHKVLTAESHDLDGDGQLEVLFIASLDYGYQLRQSISTHDSQLWMFVCSGQTGTLRWARPLSFAYNGTPDTFLEVNLDGTPLSPSVADINGDGVQDILVPLAMPNGRELATSVRSGRDGTELWSRPFATDPNRRAAFSDWIPPTVCDLDRDGRVEVVTVESRYVEATGQPAGRFQEVSALTGAGGIELWKSSIEIPTAMQYSQLHRSTEMARAHVLRAGANAQQIAVLTAGAKDQISVFDETGARRTWGSSESSPLEGLWICDVDRDGRDDIVTLVHNKLQALTAAAPSRPLWTHTLDSLGLQRVLGLQAASETDPPVMAIGRDASDNSVLGIDLSTGQRLWTVAGIISRFADGDFSVPTRTQWLNCTSDSAVTTVPHVYFSYGSVSRVRCGAASPAAQDLSQSAGPGGNLSADSITSNAFQALTRRQPDERWMRDLPWALHPISLAELLWNLAWLMLLSALLIVVPIYSVYLIVRRQFSLKRLLGLPVVAGLFLLAMLVKVPIAEDVHTLGERLVMALIYAPLVVSIGWVVSWVLGRRWRRVLIWLVCSMVSSFVCAAVMLWFDAVVDNPMLPEESYRWQGWALIWLIGTYVTAWILMLVLSSAWLLGWIKNRFRLQPRLRGLAP